MNNKKNQNTLRLTKKTDNIFNFKKITGMLRLPCTLDDTCDCFHR